MPTPCPKIYIATVLLERNRWADVRTPTFQVSEWGQRFAEAGFDGVELWENHYAMASPEERACLAEMPCPVRYFNTYCAFGEDDGGRAEAARAIEALDVTGSKFNMGQDQAQWDAEMSTLKAWEATLPKFCQLLCECHPGTMLEEPDDAVAFFEQAKLRNWGIIVHMHGGDLQRLAAWMDAFGDRIAHFHVVLTGLDDVEDRVRLIRDRGFQGTMSIEFTEGVRTGVTDMDALFASAVADMRRVREAWAS